MSPAQRSLKLLRDENYLCAIVEVWNQWSKTRNDLFGFGDILAIGNGKNILVQTTSASNIAAREAKVKAHPNAKLWLSVPNNYVEIHGWAKRKIKRGGIAIRYEVIRRRVELDGLDSPLI